MKSKMVYVTEAKLAELVNEETKKKRFEIQKEERLNLREIMEGN